MPNNLKPIDPNIKCRPWDGFKVLHSPSLPQKETATVVQDGEEKRYYTGKLIHVLFVEPNILLVSKAIHDEIKNSNYGKEKVK